MSSPRQRIESDLKAAMKARESERVSTLRMLMSEVKNEQIKSGGEIDDPAFLKIVQRAVKQRKDSAAQYRDGEREELAAKEEREAEILAAYLPAQAGEDDIRSAIEQFVDAEGLAGPQAIGPVMKAMMARFAGSADGGTINRLARDVLLSR